MNQMNQMNQIIINNDIVVFIYLILYSSFKLLKVFASLESIIKIL